MCKPQLRGQMGWGHSWCPALGHRALASGRTRGTAPPQVHGPWRLSALLPANSALPQSARHLPSSSSHRGPGCWQVGATAPSGGPDLAGSQGTEVPSYTGLRPFPETKIAPNKVIMPLTLSLTTEARHNSPSFCCHLRVRPLVYVR